MWSETHSCREHLVQLGLSQVGLSQIYLGWHQKGQEKKFFGKKCWYSCLQSNFAFRTIFFKWKNKVQNNLQYVTCRTKKKNDSGESSIIWGEFYRSFLKFSRKKKTCTLYFEIGIFSRKIFFFVDFLDKFSSEKIIEFTVLFLITLEVTSVSNFSEKKFYCEKAIKYIIFGVLIFRYFTANPN